MTTPRTAAGPTTPRGIFLRVGLMAMGYDEDSANEATATIEAEARAAALEDARAAVETFRYSEPLGHQSIEHQMWDRNEDTINALLAAIDALRERSGA